MLGHERLDAIVAADALDAQSGARRVVRRDRARIEYEHAVAEPSRER
jgi:hypothetical protein